MSLYTYFILDEKVSVDAFKGISKKFGVGFSVVDYKINGVVDKQILEVDADLPYTGDLSERKFETYQELFEHNVKESIKWKEKILETLERKDFQKRAEKYLKDKKEMEQLFEIGGFTRFDSYEDQEKKLNSDEYIALEKKRNAFYAKHGIMSSAVDFTSDCWDRREKDDRKRYEQELKDFKKYKIYFEHLVNKFSEFSVYTHFGHEHECGETLPLKGEQTVSIKDMTIETVAFLKDNTLLRITK